MYGDKLSGDKLRLCHFLIRCFVTNQITDSQDKFIYGNINGEKYLGFTATELIDRNLWDLQSPVGLSEMVLAENDSVSSDDHRNVLGARCNIITRYVTWAVGIAQRKGSRISPSLPGSIQGVPKNYSRCKWSVVYRLSPSGSALKGFFEYS